MSRWCSRRYTARTTGPGQRASGVDPRAVLEWEWSMWADRLIVRRSSSSRISNIPATQPHIRAPRWPGPWSWAALVAAPPSRMLRRASGVRRLTRRSISKYKGTNKSIAPRTVFSSSVNRMSNLNYIRNQSCC